MLSTLTVGALLLGAAQASLYGESNLNHTCVLQPQVLSCSTGAVPGKVDTCCTETFGGLLLATQFWSTYTGLESKGQKLPKNTWTIHGLWPDYCNGSYTQYCDLSRQYDPVPSPNTTNGLPNGTVVPAYKGADVSELIKPFGKNDLLAYMNRYWINQGASNAELWAHEFSKHATCFSTFDLPCYGPDYVKNEDLVDYLETAIMYYRRLPTHDWLSANKIVPSNKTTYSLSDFQTTLTKAYGAVPYVGCSGDRYNATAAGKGSTDNGRTVVSEVWYYFHVNGRPQSGAWVPINGTAPTSNCASTKGALNYYEQTAGSVF